MISIKFKRVLSMFLVLMLVLSCISIYGSDSITSGDSSVTLTVEGESEDGGNTEGGGNGGSETPGGGSTGGNGSGNGSGGNSTGGNSSNSDKGQPSGGTTPDGKDYYLKDGITVSNYVKLNGYIVGKGAWIYDPTGYLTRAEFATIMDRVFDFKGKPTSKTFTDIKGHWAEDAIVTLASHGVIKGTTDTTFDPNGTLDIDHVLLMLSRVMFIDNFSAKSSVSSANTHYSKTTISKMVNSGVMLYITNDMDLRVPITREEMVHIMNNVIYRRDKSVVSTERFVKSNGIYKDLDSASKNYYNDCLKALDMKWVKEELGVLSKIGD